MSGRRESIHQGVAARFRKSSSEGPSRIFGHRGRVACHSSGARQWQGQWTPPGKRTLIGVGAGQKRRLEYDPVPLRITSLWLPRQRIGSPNPSSDPDPSPLLAWPHATRPRQQRRECIGTREEKRTTHTYAANLFQGPRAHGHLALCFLGAIAKAKARRADHAPCAS